MTRYDGSNQRARNGALGGQYRNEWVSQVEMLALRTKEREEGKKNWLHRTGAPPLFLVRRRLAAAGNRRGQDLPEREGRGDEGRRGGSASRAWHLSGLQASANSRFLF